MKAIASECCSGLFPKNSLSGFKHCLDAGYDGVEFDIHLTSDGFIAVQHDFLLNAQITRDPNGKWLAKPGPPVAQLTQAQLKTYDIGRYVPGCQEEADYPDYRAIDNEKIPLLDEFLQYYQSISARAELWIEIKSSPFQRAISSNPEDLLKAVLQAVSDAGVIEKTIVLAFEWDLLVLAKQLRPSIQTDFLSIDPKYIKAMHAKEGVVDPSLLYGSFSPELYGNSVATAASAAGADWWGPFIRDVSNNDILAAHDLGLKVNVWGVESTPEAIAQAESLGADAITLARPDLVNNK